MPVSMSKRASISAFPFHMLPFGDRAGWLSLLEKAAWLEGFCKERNRKCSREPRVRFSLSLLMEALLGAPFRDDPERRKHPSPRLVIAHIPSMKLFGCLRPRRVSGNSLAAFARRFPIGEPIAN